MPSETHEGYIPVTGGRVWYQVVGAGDAIPLLVLHGGPGAPHDYLEPLAELANERPVVFYDQLGCGHSDCPEDRSLWRIERFVEELDLVRRSLNLKRLHLFGHSWGTMLATEYCLSHPLGIQSLILASPFLSAPHWRDDVLPRLVALLPKHVQSVLAQHSDPGTLDSTEYQAALDEYNRRYLCRLEPLPEPLQRASAAANWQIQYILFGRDEFHMTGPLKDYDRVSRLPEVTVPVLFTCGHYDAFTPEYTAWLCSCVPNAEMVVFGRGAHMAHLEESEHYVQVVRDFLQRVEALV